MHKFYKFTDYSLIINLTLLFRDVSFTVNMNYKVSLNLRSGFDSAVKLHLCILYTNIFLILNIKYRYCLILLHSF